MKNAAIACSVALSLCACADRADAPQPTSLPEPGQRISAFSARETIEDGWWHAKFRGETRYELVAIDDAVVIKATGAESASGLFRRVHVDPKSCPILEWNWRVDALQQNADLTRKDADDVAASIFILFGDPGMLSNPDPVPTIRYVWTSSAAKIDSVVDSPYLPGVVRNIVVRAGSEVVGKMVTERRNIADDFVAAFGDLRIPMVEAVALFTDNDQTLEPAVAYYDAAAFYCHASN